MDKEQIEKLLILAQEARRDLNARINQWLLTCSEEQRLEFEKSRDQKLRE